MRPKPSIAEPADPLIGGPRPTGEPADAPAAAAAGARLDGGVLQLILLGVSAVFWYGFAVPYGPVTGIPQLILLALAWSSLS
jgi:hypothetical protein